MDGKLQQNELMLLLNRMNIEITSQYLKELIDKFDKDKNKSLDMNEFIKMMDFINERKELLPIYDQFKNSASGLIHAKELLEFMEKV